MPLQMLRATAADLPELTSISLDTFQKNVYINQLIYGPRGPSASAWGDTFMGLKAAFRSPTTHILKVVDTSLCPTDSPDTQSGDYPPEAIIAWAKWSVMPFWRRRVQWDVPYQPPFDPGAGVNRKCQDAFMAPMVAKRNAAAGGRAHLHLVSNHPISQSTLRHMLTMVQGMLATRLDHERRGAGTMLLQWGIDAARDLKVPCYLEATPQGLPLYKKLGFKVFDEFDLDTTEFGGEAMWRTWYLWRPYDEEGARRGPVASEQENDGDF